MAVQLVFQGNLDPSNPNVSSRFTDAIGFYIAAPLITAELEIDVYLQVYFPAVIGEQVRNIPLGRVIEQSILLNVIDTETALAIPKEYLNTGLDMALLFLPSSTTFIQAAVVKKNCSLCQIAKDTSDIKSRLDGIEQTLNLLNLIVRALNIPIPVIPAQMNAENFNPLFILGII